MNKISATPSKESGISNHNGQPQEESFSPSSKNFWLIIPGSFTVIALSLLILKDLPTDHRFVPQLFVPLSLGLFLLGVWSVNHSHLPGWLERSLSALAFRLGIDVNRVFALLFSLMFAILATSAAGFSFHMNNLPVSIISWVTAILLALYACIMGSISINPLKRLVFVTSFILFCVSFALRAFNTAQIPIVLTGDEAASGLFSIKFLNGEMNNIFVAGWYSFPSFFNFVQSISISIFGQTTEALRLQSAFAGALTVVLVFLMGRKMFGLATAICAALMLTGLHFHNHFSRIGLNNIWDGIFIFLTLAFLWWGWQHNNRTAYALSGLCLGFAQFFYSTGRILFLIIPLWLLTASLSDWKRFKFAFPSLLLTAWIAIIVILPLAWFFVNHPDEYMASVNRVSIFNNWNTWPSYQAGQSRYLILLNQLWTALLGYVWLPLRAWYRPEVPVLRAIPASLFLLGFVQMLGKPRDTRYQMLIIWLTVIALAAALSESTPAAQRYVAAAPAVALLVGYGLENLFRLLGQMVRIRKKWLYLAAIFCALLLAADDARFYFFEYTPSIKFSEFNDRVAQHLAIQLKKEPAGQELVFCGYPNMGSRSISSLPYLAPHITYLDINSPWGSGQDPQPTGERILFVFLPDHESDKAAVEMDYPGGTWSDQKWNTGEFLYSMYIFDPK